LQLLEKSIGQQCFHHKRLIAGFLNVIVINPSDHGIFPGGQSGRARGGLLIDALYSVYSVAYLGNLETGGHIHGDKNLTTFLGS
jgi:hypothetical protein